MDGSVVILVGVIGLLVVAGSAYYFYRRSTKVRIGPCRADGQVFRAKRITVRKPPQNLARMKVYFQIQRGATKSDQWYFISVPAEYRQFYLVVYGNGEEFLLMTPDRKLWDVREVEIVK